MKITSKELAQLCGVSIGTVDRAMNNRPGISAKTKAKIFRVADEVGYHPNLLARGLVVGRTMTLGVVIFDLQNQFFSQLVNSIELHGKAQGYFIYLTLTDKSLEEERKCLGHLASLKVDGIIIFPVGKGKDFDRYLKSLRTPIVTIGNRVSGNFPFVGIDDRGVMRCAVSHIAAKGYGRIVYVSPPLALCGEINIHELEERFAGYREALQEHPTVDGSLVVKSKDIERELDALSLTKEKTAILCTSDKYALDVGQYLMRKNLRIPDDVGLMGVDNIDLLKYVSPRLTTIGYPIDLMAKKACEVVIRQIQGEEFPRSILLDCSLVEGRSL